MKSNQIIPGIFRDKRLSLLIFCAIAVFCAYQSVSAQSGRRPPRATPTPQPPVVEKPETTTPEPKDDPPVKITSLLIVGEIQASSARFSSSFVDFGLKECVRELELQKNLKLTATKGGKMNFTEAQDRAKKETDAYVLWLGYSLGADGYGNMKVTYTDYIILAPESAKKVVTGRVSSKDGGVSMPTSSDGITARGQLEAASRDIVNRLRKGGWFDD